MTIILGYADGKTVWLGSDSRCVGGWTTIDIGKRRKLFLKKDLLFGIAGASSTCDTIQRALIIPEGKRTKAPLVYLNDKLAPAIFKCLDDHHQAMIIDDFHAGIVLGMNGELYYGNTDLYFRHVAERVFALGSADGITEGAFRAFRQCGMAVEKAIMNSMSLAGERNLSIGSPYYVEKLG